MSSSQTFSYSFSCNFLVIVFVFFFVFVLVFSFDLVCIYLFRFSLQRTTGFPCLCPFLCLLFVLFYKISFQTLFALSLSFYYICLCLPLSFTLSIKCPFRFSLRRTTGLPQLSVFSNPPHLFGRKASPSKVAIVNNIHHHHTSYITMTKMTKMTKRKCRQMDGRVGKSSEENSRSRLLHCQARPAWNRELFFLTNCNNHNCNNNNFCIVKRGLPVEQ